MGNGGMGEWGNGGMGEWGNGETGEWGNGGMGGWGDGGNGGIGEWEGAFIIPRIRLLVNVLGAKLCFPCIF